MGSPALVGCAAGWPQERARDRRAGAPPSRSQAHGGRASDLRPGSMLIAGKIARLVRFAVTIAEVNRKDLPMNARLSAGLVGVVLLGLVAAPVASAAPAAAPGAPAPTAAA